MLAASAVVRSLFGAAFPLFTGYMYRDLGLHWASSVPAFLSLVCLPFPLLFYKYGQRIRSKCHYSAEAAAVLAQMMAHHHPPEGPMVAKDEAIEVGVNRMDTQDLQDLQVPRGETTEPPVSQLK